MNILLVNSFPLQVLAGQWEPTNLCYMAAFLREKGHPTEVCDLQGATRASVRRFLDEQVRGYDLIGFSTYTANFRTARWLAKQIGERYPEKTIVHGGPFVTAVPHALNNSGARFGIRGEGDLTLLELAEALEDGREDFEDVAGLIHTQDGRLHVNPHRQLIEDLDTLPFAYRDGLDPALYRVFDFIPIGGEGTPFEEWRLYTSRGCLNACQYCASATLWRRRWRARSPQNILAEIRALQERYGAIVASFVDADFGSDRGHVVGICDAFSASEKEIRWWAETSPSYLDKEQLRRMKESGCIGINLGIETGSPELQKKLVKATADPETYLQLVRDIRELGMFCTTQFLVGLPWETTKTLRETQRYLRRLEANVAVMSFVRPFPGTVLYRIACNQGWIRPDEPDQFPPSGFFPSMPTFHLSKWQVWIGFWRHVLAFYTSRKLVRRMECPTGQVESGVRGGTARSTVGTLGRILWNVLAKSLVWDFRRLVAAVTRRDIVDLVYGSPADSKGNPSPQSD